ncbi:hypothetical protein F2P45_29920 [Massilia sp. CCM 8733]|uniref:Lipoprotein n=1 Tax=Massilia mucilaginosa TaxID=2609282 RepID=A0ABX0P1L2_9BURK|nr:hypothetical protein [Massilia mucilaginosa]NHZ93198.1 hypothetical protein [Massilia mucilaginosa]
MRTFIARAACLLAFSGAALACGRDGTVAVPLAQVSLQQVAFTPSDDGRKLLVFGILKNTSAQRLRNVMLELRFFDDKHVLVDTFTRCVDNVIAPPAGEVGWRIRETIHDQMAPYASREVRIVSAEVIQPGVAQSKVSPFTRELLLTWIPVLAGIGMLVYLLRKVAGKHSSSSKAVVLMEAQIAYFEKNLHLLERLVLASEARARGVILPPGDEPHPPR